MKCYKCPFFKWSHCVGNWCMAMDDTLSDECVESDINCEALEERYYESMDRDDFTL